MPPPPPVESDINERVNKIDIMTANEAFEKAQWTVLKS